MREDPAGRAGMVGYTCSPRQTLSSHSLYHQLHGTTATKQPFPKIRGAARHCACTASPSSRTTAIKKLNPSRAAGNPRSSQPHWARIELYPQLKPHLGLLRAKQGEAVVLQLLLERHLIWVIVIFQKLIFSPPLYESNTPGLDSCSPNSV